MIRSIALVLTMAFASTAMADGPACNPAAKEKKLAGAAKPSFLTECQKDAKAACEAKSAEKKLAGAAKTHTDKSA